MSLICAFTANFTAAYFRGHNNAFKSYYRNNSKSLTSVCCVPHTSFPEKIMTLDVEDKLLFSNLYSGIQPRQAINSTYYARNSAIYIIHSSLLDKGLIFNRSDYYLMPSSRSVDIDSIDDLNHAELLLRGVSHL